jgi:transposase
MDTPLRIRSAIITHPQTGFYTQQQISNMLNRSRSTVRDVIHHFQRHGTSSPKCKKRCGRKRQLNFRDMRAVARVSMINLSFTAREVQAGLGGTTATLSVDTVKRELRCAGVKTYRPCASPCLNSAQRAARLRWCQEHQFYTKDQWRKVSFIGIYSHLT